MNNSESKSDTKIVNANATERKEASWSLSNKRERLYSSTHDHLAFCKTNHQDKG